MKNFSLFLVLICSLFLLASCVPNDASNTSMATTPQSKKKDCNLAECACMDECACSSACACKPN